MHDNPTQPKYLTITLSDHVPVRIIEESWPIIAQGSFQTHDSEAFITIFIKVRQHLDGRSIVAGFFDHKTIEHHLCIAAGYLCVPGYNVVRAIRATGRDIIGAIAGRVPGTLIQLSDVEAECIASLQPEDLT